MKNNKIKFEKYITIIIIIIKIVIFIIIIINYLIHYKNWIKQNFIWF